MSTPFPPSPRKTDRAQDAPREERLRFSSASITCALVSVPGEDATAAAAVCDDEPARKKARRDDHGSGSGGGGGGGGGGGTTEGSTADATIAVECSAATADSLAPSASPPELVSAASTPLVPSSSAALPAPTVTAAMLTEAEHTLRAGIASRVLLDGLTEPDVDRCPSCLMAAHDHLLADARRPRPPIDPNLTDGRGEAILHKLLELHIQVEGEDELTPAMCVEARAFLPPLLRRGDLRATNPQGESLLGRIASCWPVSNTHHISWVWLEAILAVPSCTPAEMNAALLKWAFDKEVTSGRAIQLLLEHGADVTAVDQVS